jgi:hypothetical protein
LDMKGWIELCTALKSSNTLVSFSAADIDMNPEAVAMLADAIKAMAVLASLNLSGNSLTGATAKYGNAAEYGLENVDSEMEGFVALCAVLSRLTEVNLSDCWLGPASITELTKVFRDARAAIEKVNVSGCDVTQEAAAQLLTAANEASRARLRAHQVLAFSEALHARLGSECLLQAVAIDADVWRRIAENIRERHGHELMCARLAQAGQTWFEVTVEGLIAEGVPR